MPLTDMACRNLKPGERPRKVADGDGLYLLVQPNGSKLWRMNYREGGKQKTLSFGKYPFVSLSDARAKHAAARRNLYLGLDPNHIAAPTEVPTFESVGREWLRMKSEARWVPAYRDRMVARFEADLFPEIGHLPIAEIEAPELLAALRKVEVRGVYETTHRLLQMIGMVMRYAIATGRAARDPAADLKGALKPKPRVKHMTALKATDLPEFLRKLADYDGEQATRIGVELVLHTMTRTNEMRFARWHEFEGDVWRIPGDRMKMRREHLVPITPHVRGLLDALPRDSEWGLPGLRGPMSENTMIFAIYRMGYHRKATIHGFRRTASTILNESGLWSPDAIEMQLAHVPGGVRGIYNAAQYMSERRRMLHWWSDYLATRVVS